MPKQTYEEAITELRKALSDTFRPPLLALVNGLDSLLARWPWLYRRLGG